MVGHAAPTVGGGSIPTPSLQFRIQRVVDKEMRVIARDFVNTHHSYIKWADRPSRRIYWLLYENQILVGVFGIATVYARPRAVTCYLVEHDIRPNEAANNIVYALFGNLDKNAGTRFLKIIRRDARIWWKERYGDDLKALQTFILPPRTGALYKADNWQEIGRTTGKTMTTRELSKKERASMSEMELKSLAKPMFNGDGSSQTRYLVREFQETEIKLIFMRMLV